jgi:hypothetical protein
MQRFFSEAVWHAKVLMSKKNPEVQINVRQDINSFR